MRCRLWVLALGTVLAHAGAALGQGPEPRVPAVDAGRSATVMVQLPAPQDVDSASYTLALSDGYRPFVPTAARIGRMDDLFIIPISFTTPDRLPAGRVVAGTLTVDIDGYETTSRELVIQIRERREVTFALEADEVTIAPDAVVGIPFRAHNLGNRRDTVFLDIRAGDAWSLIDAPRLILEPGDSVRGALRIAAPPTVTPGDRELVLVTARTAAREQTRTVNMVVVSPEGWLGGLAQVPSSIFVGQALETGAAPVVALTGGGRIGPETELRLDVRHSDAGILDPALQRQMAGARLRAVITRPDLELHAGDVYGFRTTLSGPTRQARGLRAHYDPDGALSFRAMAARPAAFDGATDGGYILHGEAETETRYGAVALLGGDMLYPARGGLVATRSSGAGLRWAGALGSHEGSVEGTLVRFTAADSLERTGPAVDVRYRLSTERVTGRFQLRRVPDAATAPGGRGNELSGSLSTVLVPGLYLVGWGYSTEQNLLGNGSTTASSAANVGLRSRIARFQLQLGATLTDRLTTTAADTFGFARSTVRGEASYDLGSLSLQSDAEVGTSRELGRDGAYRSIGGSVRFYGSGRSGWIRTQYSRRPGGMESTNLHAGGTIALGPATFSAGLTTTLAGALTTTSFWSGTEIQAQRNLTVHIGASARPTLDAQDWTFSLGVSRRINLPLPIARQPDLRGVVFDDANDNGVLDAGEATVSGVTLALGYLTTTTDSDGRFAFRDATGARLQLQSGDLPMGYVPSPRTVLPTRGRAAIPLLRTATLHLDLFLDRDEDGQRDHAETPGSGAAVTVTDERGRQRTATADDSGTVRISGLLPGRYAVTARPAAAPARGGREPEVLMEVELAPGAEVRHTLAVPLRRRTIRMGGDDGGLPFLD